jgi:hypothetical protein
MGIDGGNEDLAVADRDAAICRSAADLLDGDLVLVVPNLLACPGIERRDAGHRLGQIHHAIGDNRGGLERRCFTGLVDPFRDETFDITVRDLVERREAQIGIGASIHQPVVFVLIRRDEASRSRIRRMRGKREPGEPNQTASEDRRARPHFHPFQSSK